MELVYAKKAHDDEDEGIEILGFGNISQLREFDEEQEVTESELGFMAALERRNKVRDEDHLVQEA